MASPSVFHTVQSLLRGTLPTLPHVLCDVIHEYLPRALSNTGTPSKVERFVLERFRYSQNPTLAPPPLEFPSMIGAKSHELCNSHDSHVWKSAMSDRYFVALINNLWFLTMVTIPLKNPAMRWSIEIQGVQLRENDYSLEVRGEYVVIPLNTFHVYSITESTIRDSRVECPENGSVSISGGDTVNVLSTTYRTLASYRLPEFELVGERRTLSAIGSKNYDLAYDNGYLLDRHLIIPFHSKAWDFVHTLDTGEESLWPHVGKLRLLSSDGGNCVASVGPTVVTFFAESRSSFEIPVARAITITPPILFGSHIIFKGLNRDIAAANILATQPGPVPVRMISFNDLLFQGIQKLAPGLRKPYTVCSESELTIFHQGDSLVVMAVSKEFPQKTLAYVYPTLAAPSTASESCCAIL